SHVKPRHRPTLLWAKTLPGLSRPSVLLLPNPLYQFVGFLQHLSRLIHRLISLGGKFVLCLSGLHPRAPDLVTILSVPQLTGCSPGFRRCILDVAMNRCTARHTSEPPPAR